jgi:hypothetical protein
MTGKVARLRFVRIASLPLVPDLVDVADLEAVVGSEGDSAAVEALEAAEALVVASAAEVLVVVTEELLVASMLGRLLHHPTPSRTTLLRALREARRSMFATHVFSPLDCRISC